MVSYRALLVFILALALATAAAAQPTETCAGADLDGSQTFTFSGDLSVTTDDFTLPVTCNELGPDSVVCFTPTNGCTVNVGCERDSGNQSVNMFTGSCSLTPSSCFLTTPAAAAPLLSGVVLSGGQNYCVVCEHDGTGFATTTITQTSGDCGPLPVQLYSFGVESAETETSAGEGPTEQE